MSEATATNPAMPADPLGTRGPLGAAAFFDMDNTVLRSSSGRLYLRYLRSSGYLPWTRWAVITGQVALYVTGLIDFPHLMARLMTQVAGAEEAETWRISEAWFRDMLRDHITEGARERIAWHRGQGHHVALVSASTPYAVAPVARDLGLADAYLATNLEVVAGRFTGRVVEPACYGPGKLAMTQEYAARLGLTLAQSYFYSDSQSDLPLLEAVGHPVAVNPNRTAGADRRPAAVAGDILLLRLASFIEAAVGQGGRGWRRLCLMPPPCLLLSAGRDRGFRLLMALASSSAAEQVRRMQRDEWSDIITYEVCAR